MVIPPVIMLIPLFKLMSALKMTNSYYGISIIYIGLMLPFSIYVLTSFFKNIDKEIVDAALIDGCTPHNILFRIFIPMSMPPIITILVVNSLFCWNELLLAIVFLEGTTNKTLMAAITIFRNKYMGNIPTTMAGLSMMTIPMIILYFLGTRFFIKGLTSGALKG
jgi:ABC-type glycerol-3-phosphate transport system permease component